MKLAFNKPYGVLTRFTDPSGRPTLKDYIQVPGVYPVGRLDRDSEGLLLLTDEAAFQTALLRPGKHWKTYWAQVEGVVTEEALSRLRAGVELDGRGTLPARAEFLKAPDLPERPVPIRFRKTIPTSWLALSLSEGRNRQVRRMTAAVGLPTLRLVRVQIGPVSLEGLAPGQWRQLTPAEERWARGI